MQDASLVNDLTQGSVSRKLLRFSIPFLIANLLQVVYSLVDMLFVGQAVGSVGLSAVSIGSQITFVMLNIGAGMTTGSQVTISQLVGAQQHSRIQSAVGTSLTFFGLISAVLMVIGAVFARPICLLLNTPEEALAQATSYLFICSLGMLFIFGYNSICAILRGMGDSRHPLIFVLIATVVNIVLDYLFVMRMGMGATGAALATVIGQGVAFVYALVFLYRSRASFGFDFRLRSFAIDGKLLKIIVKLGLPLAIQNTAVSFSMLYMTSWVNTCGLAATAAAGIGQKLQSIVGTISAAFCASCSAMVGQNIGAGKYDRVRKTIWTAMGICVAMALVCTVVFFLWPTAIFRCFTADAQVLALAPSFLKIVLVMIFAFAFMSPTNGLVNGVGNTLFGMVVGILDGVVGRISLSLLFGHFLNWGLNGYYLGNGLAGFITVIATGTYFLSGRWKKRKALVGES